jgi:hypothetical protein
MEVKSKGRTKPTSAPYRFSWAGVAAVGRQSAAAAISTFFSLLWNQMKSNVFSICLILVVFGS